jgi:hypothetical protein
MAVTWIKKGRGVLFGQEGENFIVALDYTTDDAGRIVVTTEIRTLNLRAACIVYSDAIAARILRALLNDFEKQGYDPYTGEKERKEPA